MIYQCNFYQIEFVHTARIKMFLFFVGYGESNETTGESKELNCKTHEKHHEVEIQFTPWLELERLN